MKSLLRFSKHFNRIKEGKHAGWGELCGVVGAVANRAALEAQVLPLQPVIAWLGCGPWTGNSPTVGRKAELKQNLLVV